MKQVIDGIPQQLLRADFDAYSILYADTDNIPVALTVGASRIVGRKASGGIVALTASEVATIVEASIESAIDTLANLTSIQGHTITLTGDLVMSGAYNLTLTLTGATGVVLPTSGTLATLAGTEELDNKTLDASVGKGTWTASGTWQLPAHTSGAITLIGDLQCPTSYSLVIKGKRQSSDEAVYIFTPGVGAGYTDTVRLTLTGRAAISVAAWADVYHTGVKYGLAGTATGAFTIDGATSGVVTVTVAATAGTWTMTLPTGVAGGAGYQLTDAAPNGTTSWAAAASQREYKNIIGEVSPQEAIDKILNTKVYRFHYKEGVGTMDTTTEYVGVMADEAPWAMHYKGGVVNPVNTLGYMVLGFQALDAKIERLESELTELKASLN